MMRRVLNAYHVESIKAFRSRATYVGPILIVLLIGAALFVHPVRRDEHSDYDFIAYAAPSALNVLGTLLIVSYSAGLVAGEISSGTIRLVLVRPLRRGEFILAKFLVGLTYAMALTALAGITAWSAAWILGDLTGVRFGGEVLYTDRDMRVAFLMAIGLNLPPQFAAVAYALFVSTCIRNAASAVIVSVGAWILLDAIKYPLNIAPYLFSSYLDSSWQPFSERCMGIESAFSPSSLFGIGVSVVSMIVFLTGAALVLSRKDLSA